MTLLEIRAERITDSYINIINKDIEVLQQAQNLYTCNYIDHKTISRLFEKRIIFIENRIGRLSKVLSHYDLSNKAYDDSCDKVIELYKFYSSAY